MKQSIVMKKTCSWEKYLVTVIQLLHLLSSDCWFVETVGSRQEQKLTQAYMSTDDWNAIVSLVRSVRYSQAILN